MKRTEGSLRISRLTLDYDVAYGIDARTGYSVCIDGTWVVQFEPRLLPALWKAWRAYRAWGRQ